MPERIQLRRTKGWRMPAGAVKVDRSTKWGNPHDWRSWREDWNAALPGAGPFSEEVGRDDWCRAMAVQAFREDLADGTLARPVGELRGKDLACWCAPGSPCHADVLLELANRDEVAA